MRVVWTAATDAPASPCDTWACLRARTGGASWQIWGRPHESAVGDRISIPGRHVGDVRREGEVVELRGTQEAPLYVVRWDDGHEGVCSPGAERQVTHRTPT